MKAPNKIYYHKGSLRTPYANEHRLDNTDVEYICKDVLIDYLKKKANEIEIAIDTGADDPVLWGERNAIEQVIKKINTM